MIRPASQLRAAKNLDQILYQLSHLREHWQFLTTSKKVQSLSVAADGLDDIISMIDSYKQMRAEEFAYSPIKKRLFNILLLFPLAACLFSAGVLVGIEYGCFKSNPGPSPVVNFARMGP